MRNTRPFILTALASVALLSGCARIATGEVGLRQNFDKTIEKTELVPGSLNQIFVGEVLIFKVQDVAVNADNLRVVASDNSTMKDFDISAIYSINQTAVSDLWTSKNRSFHTRDENGDILLMNKYVEQVLRNASYKAARPYDALTMADSRSAIEAKTKDEMAAAFKEEGLGASITVSQVQVRSVVPADSITESANALVRAQNDLKTKTIEVQTAGKEAERINALNANPKAIEYMNAQATMMVAQAMLAGKVQSVVVPFDFKGIIGAK